MQLDAYLIPHGRRLRDLNAGEFLSFVYGRMVDGMTAQQRAQFDAALTPPRPRSTGARQANPVPDWAAKRMASATVRHDRGDVNVRPAPRVPQRPPPRRR